MEFNGVFCLSDKVRNIPGSLCFSFHGGCRLHCGGGFFSCVGCLGGSYLGPFCLFQALSQ